MADKVLENRLRRKLARMGYRLEKSRRRDPDAIDYGKYWVIDLKTNVLVFGGSEVNGIPDATLEEVANWITEHSVRDHAEREVSGRVATKRNADRTNVD
jgi:hypothetical protein